MTSFIAFSKLNPATENVDLVSYKVKKDDLAKSIVFNHESINCRSSREQRRRYREVERKAHEIKSLTSSVEAPLQLTLVLYLMLRGILSLPWNEPMSSSCIQDNLGRVACLPSIPMLSITFSVLSILKAMFDLNVHPLFANKVSAGYYEHEHSFTVSQIFVVTKSIVRLNLFIYEHIASVFTSSKIIQFSDKFKFRINQGVSN